MPSLSSFSSGKSPFVLLWHLFVTSMDLSAGTVGSGPVRTRVRHLHTFLNLCLNAFFLLQVVAGVHLRLNQHNLLPTQLLPTQSTAACGRGEDCTHIQKHTRSAGLVETTAATRGTLAFFLERVINEKALILPHKKRTQHPKPKG